ncbi:hypothetical protein GIX83_02340 [Lactobacillus reuteri]|uniref:Uncharacterized protein n=2 Tax=Limosilactobacillus reuteri TaxID=1598 RepID=A0A6A8D1V8_LIMRT|nr:super-infection exclusion protein B [Limosilactobacillus reuteri]MCH9393591.1 super-infection exclusion protein B [Limosilactobacillus reuteri]MRG68662.1 hypothetical protein [Limosilactobacillus reuteri]MRG68712.1 hypothetical protein [Limosilactobacillus reuteri]
MDYIKQAMDALKMDTKSRLIGLSAGIIVLLLKPFAKVLSMTYFYNKFTWIVVLITIFFVASLVIDLVNRWYDKKRVDKENKRKRSERLQKQRQFENYIFNLSGRKRRIIHDMYRNYHHRDYVSVNDSDALDLLMHNVILPTKVTQRVDILGRENEYNELQELFILAPRVVQIIDMHKEKFNW